MGDLVSRLPRIVVIGFLVLLVLASLAAFLYGVFGEPGQQTWASLLVVSFYLLAMGLGGAVLLALLSVTGARWSDDILPITEKLVALLPAGAVGVMLVLLCSPDIYPWTQPGGIDPSASPFKAAWLSRPFFLIRAACYLVLWLALTNLLVRLARRNTQGQPRSTGWAGFFLVVYAFTFWLASTDWIMSLEPQWFSTVFGVYNFAGMFLSVLAAVIVLAYFLQPGGEHAITADNWHDLGTLLFSFSCFWMYIWFCQYMLIWYVNNPEETTYYILRQKEALQPLVLASLILNWGVPFIVLLFRPAKRNATVLALVAVLVLCGRWLDWHLMILPPVAGHEGATGLVGVALVPGMVGLAGLAMGTRLVRSTRTA